VDQILTDFPNYFQIWVPPSKRAFSATVD